MYVTAEVSRPYLKATPREGLRWPTMTMFPSIHGDAGAGSIHPEHPSLPPAGLWQGACSGCRRGCLRIAVCGANQSWGDGCGQDVQQQLPRLQLLSNLARSGLYVCTEYNPFSSSLAQSQLGWLHVGMEEQSGIRISTVRCQWRWSRSMFGDPYSTTLAVWGQTPGRGVRPIDARCDLDRPFHIAVECPEREAQPRTRTRTPEAVRRSLFWQLGHGLLDLCFGVMPWMT